VLEPQQVSALSSWQLAGAGRELYRWMARLWCRLCTSEPCRPSVAPPAAVSEASAPHCPPLASHAPNRSSKLAAVTSDKVVYLFDEHGEKRDKFKTKAADAAAQPAYVVRGMAFSPDSQRLAVAQSDGAVFVYRWARAQARAGRPGPGHGCPGHGCPALQPSQCAQGQGASDRAGRCCVLMPARRMPAGRAA
jgi:hypothetical protein